MENRFYNKSPKEKLKIQFLIALGGFLAISLSIYVSKITDIYLLPPLIFTITVSVIAPFFDVPAMIAQGNVKYHSAFFLSEKPKNGILRIHGGTLFDYVFVINGKLNGKQRTDFIIHQYLQGFLKFTEEHERGYDDKLIIRGTSYIMNKKTATKLGFKIVETDVIQKVLLLYHAVNIILSYSIAKGKLSFPNLRQTITFEATLGELIKQKPYIQELISRFQSQHQKKP